MADITMCMNTECSKKLECKRYIAIPNKVWQSYFATYPEEDLCKHFMKATKSDKELYEVYQENLGKEQENEKDKIST